jgi:hypothetical protein
MRTHSLKGRSTRVRFGCPINSAGNRTRNRNQNRSFRDRTGGITFGDFMEFLSVITKGSTEDKLLWAFTFYDVNRDGVISREELIKVSANKPFPPTFLICGELMCAIIFREMTIFVFGTQFKSSFCKRVYLCICSFKFQENVFCGSNSW